MGFTLRIRYSSNPRGVLTRQAVVYTQKEHRLPPEGVDPDAMRIIGRLRHSGHAAYIVGGAVRDLLLGRKPKDFDIATDAHPRRIRRLFSNSRIIGRRFQIVHIFFPDRKIFEITTFRAGPPDPSCEPPADEEETAAADDRAEAPEEEERPRGGRAGAVDDSEFGTIDQDVWRRDFSINALYYDPFEKVVLDYVGGLRDIRDRKLRTLRPAADSFLEDPVRMIRAVRYAGQTGFRLSMGQRRLIRHHRGELNGCSMERMTEELYKILKCGYAAPVMELAFRSRLLDVLMPALDRFLAEGLARGKPLSALWRLEELDKRVRERPGEEIDRGELLAYLLAELFADWSGGIRGEDQRVEEPVPTALQLLRPVTGPLKPSNRELRVAAYLLLGLDPAAAEEAGGEGERAGRTRDGRPRRRRPERRAGAADRQAAPAAGRPAQAAPGREAPRDAAGPGRAPSPGRARHGPAGGVPAPGAGQAPVPGPAPAPGQAPSSRPSSAPEPAQAGTAEAPHRPRRRRSRGGRGRGGRPRPDGGQPAPGGAPGAAGPLT